MGEQVANGNGYTEAPASFTVKAISPQGFDCMLTIRDNDSGKLMPRALKALEWLGAQGFTPTGRGGRGNANGNAPLCPTHGTPMKPSKGKGWYCPQKVADDDGTGKPVYCKQTVK